MRISIHVASVLEPIHRARSLRIVAALGAGLWVTFVGAIPSRAEPAEPVWTATYDDGIADAPQDLAVDAAGRTVVAGVTASAFTTVEGLFVAGFAPDGARLWQATETASGANSWAATAVGLDSQGNSVLVGGWGQENGRNQYRVVKRGKDGGLLWRFSTEACCWEPTVSVRIAPDDSVYAALSSEVIHFGADGTVLWRQAVDDPDGNGGVRPIALDRKADLVVAGGAGNNERGITIRKIAPSGETLWQKRHNAKGIYGSASSVAIDASNHIVVAGRQFDAVDQCVVLKLDASGRLLWEASYAAPRGTLTQPGPVAVDASGNVYCLIYNAPLAQVAVTQGAVFIKFDSQGRLQWTGRRLESFGRTPLVVSPDGRAFIGGRAIPGGPTMPIWMFAPNGNGIAVASGPNGWANALALGVDGSLWAAGTGVRVDGVTDAVVSKYPAGLGAEPLPLSVSVKVTPTSNRVLEGSDISFQALVAGEGLFDFQWRHMGRVLAGETGPDLTIANATVLQDGDYSVVVSGGAGEVYSTESRLQVVVPPRLTPVAQANRILSSGGGQTLVLSAEVAGDPPLSLQWLRDGRVVKGATNALLVLPVAGPARSGKYVLVASNAFGMTAQMTNRIELQAPGPLDAWAWRSPAIQGNDLNAVVGGRGRLVAVGNRGTILVSQADGSWEDRSLRTDLNLTGVAAGPDRFVATASSALIDSPPSSGSDGFGGAIWTSAEGEVWDRVILPRQGNLRGVVWAAGQFIAVGQGLANGSSLNGFVLRSADGLHWTDVTPVTGLPPLRVVAFGNGRFVAAPAVGPAGAGRVVTSPDGIGWTVESINDGVPAPYYFESVVGGPESFLGFSFALQDQMTYVSEDGVHWRGGSPMMYANRAATFTGGRFVVIGLDPANGGKSVTYFSADGRTFSEPVTNGLGDQRVSAMTALGHRIAAVGAHGNLATSEDGVAWRIESSGTGNNFRSVTHALGRFVAVGNEGAIAVSTDGASWRRLPSPGGWNLHAVHFLVDRFWAVSESAHVNVSADGETWSEVGLGADYPLYDLTHAGGRFVAVGGVATDFGSRGVIVTSTNGANWTPVQVSSWTPTSPEGVESLHGVAWGAGRFVAVGVNGIHASEDGTVWEPVYAKPAFWKSAAYGNGRFVVVGAAAQSATSNLANAIRVSADGLHWEEPGPNGGVLQDLDHVTYANGLFVAVGERGGIFSSPDGLEWIEHRSVTDERLRAVAYGGGRFVAVGNNDIALQTADFRSGHLAVGRTVPAGPMDLTAWGEAGATYRLEAGDAVAGGTWSEVRTFQIEKQGQSILQVPMDAAATRAKYYRLRAEGVVAP